VALHAVPVRDTERRPFSITAFHSVIASCAQTLYALRVLRAHDLCDSALQTVYRAVVVAMAKLTLYASSAWIGFSSANDRQKITAFIRRSKHTGFCSSQLDDFRSLADTQLFTEILHNPCHVLQALFTPPADYNLRDEPHNRQLPDRMSHFTNCNFIVWMLFCDSYWLYRLYHLVFFGAFLFTLRSDSCSIKETFWRRYSTSVLQLEHYYAAIFIGSRIKHCTPSVCPSVRHAPPIFSK